MNRFDLVTLAAVAVAIVLAGAASFALVAGSSPAALPSLAPDPWATGGATPTDAGGSGGASIVDVEGGVTHPGIWELPSGSRVADALAAAGGYAESADLVAAAQSLNLAASLVDGQQIYVPVLGAAPPATGSGGTGGGLVNLNRATQSELEALPGIGPVTAAKIIAARTEQPFATLDELVGRKVLTAHQLEQIVDLVTVP